MAIDWTKPNSKISQFFTVREAIHLPQWNRLATEKDGLGPAQKANLVMLMVVMDKVRTFFGKPIVVHCCFRPYAYNALVGGAPKSAHIAAMAIDFHVAGLDCDEARKLLLPKLEEWGLRMEDLPGSSWVHLDMRPVPKGGTRFFKP
jgi:uncharacterized protein YcbK (DUF882 family)